MQLQLVTPIGPVIDAQVDQVLIPGAQGEFGVLPGHIPFLSAVRPGVLSYTAKGRREQIAVAGGLAEVGAHEKIVVLVENACRLQDVDAQSLRLELLELQEQLKAWSKPIATTDAAPDPEYRRLQDQVRWIEARLQLV